MIVERFNFAVPIRPVGKARPRFRRFGNKVLTYTPETTRRFEEELKVAARNAGLHLPDPEAGPVEIRMTVRAYFGGRRRSVIPRTKRPDLDNIVKIVMDAMNGVLYDDDSAVTAIRAEKYDSARDLLEIYGIRIYRKHPTITSSRTANQ